MLPELPVQVCCGERHAGVVCPDGYVMCCLCWNRFDQLDLAVENGVRVDVCEECAVADAEAVQRAEEIT